MDRSRRIKALKTLQRIKEHELDEQAAKMGVIRAAQGNLQRERDDLDHRLETETQITTPEAAPFLAGFLHAVQRRREFIDGEMVKLDEKAALIEGRLFETYTEVRTNENVLDKSLFEKRREEDLAESSALEEVARNRYMRQMGGSS
ncbi:hypothetical protein [Cognatishimia sp.]|uniref:hypothetical protein n=1 Tax=Cognatishimia sp. TaxID=2211648 RepID=UPI0035181F33